VENLPNEINLTKWKLMKQINVYMVIILSEPHHLSLLAALITNTSTDHSMASVLHNNEAERK